MKHFTLILMAVATICTQSFAQTRVRNIYADVKSLNVELLQNTDQTVQLNRHLFAGYNTLCMPMSMSAEQVSNAASDVRVERFVGIGQEEYSLPLLYGLHGRRYSSRLSLLGIFTQDTILQGEEH